MAIYFFYQNVQPNLEKRQELKVFLQRLFEREKRQLLSLTYIFCTDDYLLSINKAYLNHNYFTDIITFDLTTNKKEGIIGEIYISWDRVKDNAVKMNCSFKEEVHRVIFHGALHLCGYKDKQTPDQARMRKAENQYLDLYFSK